MAYLAPDPPLTAGDLTALLRGGVASAVRPSGTFYASGRMALLAGLEALGIGPGDDVLLPAYLCESVVTPVETVGATPVFYPVGRDLAVEASEVDAAITPRTRAVVVIHYFGFPGPLGDLRALCDRRGLLLIEDCAHALYSRDGARPLGTVGDLAFFSPWKSLALPDGGVLVVNRPAIGQIAAPPGPRAPRTLARLAYRALGTAEQAVGWSPRLALLRRPGLRRDLHRRVSAGAIEREGGSAIARRLFVAADPSQVVRRRRGHYARLLDAARGLGWARPLWNTLPSGACPLGLPLVADDRDARRDWLLGHGVNVRTYWEHLPPAVDPDRFPDAAWLRDRILVLPAHQRLQSGRVEWLARLLLESGER